MCRRSSRMICSHQFASCYRDQLYYQPVCLSSMIRSAIKLWISIVIGPRIRTFSFSIIQHWIILVFENPFFEKRSIDAFYTNRSLIYIERFLREGGSSRSRIKIIYIWRLDGCLDSMLSLEFERNNGRQGITCIDGDTRDPWERDAIRECLQTSKKPEILWILRRV